MASYQVLYNPSSNNRRGEAEAHALDAILKDDVLTYRDVMKLGSYREFLMGLPADEKVVICGGDGTLNRLVNDLNGYVPVNEIYYLGAGSGNDFLNDLGRKPADGLVKLNEYIKDLPVVTVNGKTSRFINGVGYGIDGYCCEEGDKRREKSDKPVNYTSIAISGLLFHFKPVNATVTVDGVKHTYKKVWLAPTMNGRCYGGGMMPTPAQDRLDPERKLSVLVYHGVGKLKALIVFPSIFKGEHLKHEKMCEVLTGHEITVEFDRPTALQIDGETVVGVTKYTAKSAR